MTWLLALVLRPFAALLLFGFAAFVAIVLLKPLIPDGRVKRLLYDRTLRERRPEVFNAVVILLIVALVSFGIWIANRAS